MAARPAFKLLSRWGRRARPSGWLPRAGQGQAPPSRLHNPSIRYLLLLAADQGGGASRRLGGHAENSPGRNSSSQPPLATAPARRTPHSPALSPPGHWVSVTLLPFGRGDEVVPLAGREAGASAAGTGHDPCLPRLTLHCSHVPEWSPWPGFLCPEAERNQQCSQGCG